MIIGICIGGVLGFAMGIVVAVLLAAQREMEMRENSYACILGEEWRKAEGGGR